VNRLFSHKFNKFTNLKCNYKFFQVKFLVKNQKYISKPIIQRFHNLLTVRNDIVVCIISLKSIQCLVGVKDEYKLIENTTSLLSFAKEHDLSFHIEQIVDITLDSIIESYFDTTYYLLLQSIEIKGMFGKCIRSLLHSSFNFYTISKNNTTTFIVAVENKERINKIGYILQSCNFLSGQLKKMSKNEIRHYLNQQVDGGETIKWQFLEELLHISINDTE